jgi:hypothetical protein
VPNARSQTYQVAEVAFAPDGLRGTENLLFNRALGEVPRPETFLGRWHRTRITYDMTQAAEALGRRERGRDEAPGRECPAAC